MQVHTCSRYNVNYLLQQSNLMCCNDRISAASGHRSLHYYSTISSMMTRTYKHLSFDLDVFNSALLFASLPAYGAPLYGVLGSLYEMIMLPNPRQC